MMEVMGSAGSGVGGVCRLKIPGLSLSLASRELTVCGSDFQRSVLQSDGIVIPAETWPVI